MLQTYRMSLTLPLNPTAKISLCSPFFEDTVGNSQPKLHMHTAILSILLPEWVHVSSGWPGHMPSSLLTLLLPPAQPNCVRWEPLCWSPYHTTLQIKLLAVHVCPVPWGSPQSRSVVGPSRAGFASHPTYTSAGNQHLGACRRPLSLHLPL